MVSKPQTPLRRVRLKGKTTREIVELQPQVGPRVGVVRNVGDATGLAPAPWLTFQPDVQYIIRPGGTGMVPDAVVLGV